jgi:catechol 2,3-dioxygenase-like lactoylglutathione lyase family enzyme
MRIGHVELPVADPLRSLRFYVDVLGFELVDNQADRFIWVHLGGTQLLLRPGPPRPPGDPDETPNIVLYTEDLAALRAGLANRGLSFERRGACEYFQDPDGHWFQLVDPMEDHSA